MKIRILSLLPFVIALLVSVPAFAELGEAPMPQIEQQKNEVPTLKETQKWLSEKIDEMKFYEFPDTGEYARPGDKWRWEQSISVNGCLVKYSSLSKHYYTSEGIFIDSHDWRNDDDHLYSFNLADLDRSSLEIKGDDFHGTHQRYYWVRIKSMGQKENIKYGHTEYPEYSKYVNVLAITYIQDASLAERIKNALQHAITLCQADAAKKEQAKPARNEPF